MRIAPLIAKELLVLRKDWHGLLVLFVMPALFILIMSLAMRDTFSERHQVTIHYLLLDQDASADSHQLAEHVGKLEGFVAAPLPDKSDVSSLQHLVATDRYQFMLVIPQGFAQQLSASKPNEALLKLRVAPSVTPQLQLVFRMALEGQLRAMRMKALTDSMPIPLSMRVRLPDFETLQRETTIDSRYLYPGSGAAPQPTSVQQSVPAWLVFAMFFVVIPLSTAFIIERQQGSLLRLRIMNISSVELLLGKIIPYFLINQVQMVLMVLVGIYLVPRLGGDTLQISGSLSGLVIISAATSLAAICYALLITTLAKTHVQATTLGGVSNIIFGALGGVMVPKFVMPPFMRELANVSPMSWGLEGFLDIFLRGGGWREVLPEAGALLLLAALALGAATLIFSRGE